MTAAQPVHVAAATQPVRLPIPDSRLLILGYVALGAFAGAVYFLTDGIASAGAYLLVSFLPVAALVAGPHILRAASVWPWYLLAAGQAGFFVGDLIWFADELSSSVVSVPSLADVAYIVGYPLMAAGLGLFIWHRQPTRWLAPLVDAFAIGIAGTLLLWLVHIETFIHDVSLPLLQRLTLLTYPIGDALLIGAAAYLLLAGGRVGMAQRLLVLSLGLLLAADIAYSGMVAGDGYSAGWADGLWLGGYLVIGLAALVPSMRGLTERQPTRSRQHEGRHVLVLFTALVVVPLFALLQQVFVGHIDGEVIVLTEVVLVGLLVLRTRDLSRAARRQDERYRALMAGASDTFMVVKPDGTVQTGGPAARQLLGIAPDSLLGMNVFDLLDPADPDLPDYRQQFEQVVALDGASSTRVVRALHADGQPRWLSVTATNRLADPAVAGLVLNMHDVTETHVAGEEVHFQAQLLANLREAVISTDLQGRVTHWNPGATALFGYAADEMMGKTPALLYADGPGPIAGDLTDILAGKYHYDEWQARRKDGSRVWVHVRTGVLRDGQGEPSGFIGVSSDISQRLQANALVARLAAATEQSSESVMIANIKAEIEYVNPAFERSSGYTRDEVLGQNPRFLQSGVQSQAYYEAMWATLTAGRPWIGDFTNKRKDGTLFEEEGVITPIRTAAGEISGYVAVKRDVTSERTLQRRAQELARERALIADTLRALDGRDDPKAVTQALCRQVVSLSQMAIAGLFVFEPDGRAIPYGVAIPGVATPPLRSVPLRRSTHLRARAESGSWIEAWRDDRAHPYNETITRLGVRSFAYAPVRDRGSVIGVLLIGCAAERAEEVLANALPALIEFADIAGTLIGPKVAAGSELEAVRRRIRRSIRGTEFRTVFQPLIDVEVQATVGYEALSRFDDGVAPDLRFAEAASFGLGRQLELATMRLAIEAAESLPENAWLNLNASPSLILESRELSRLLAKTSRKIVLEITEHAEITDYRKFRVAIERLGPDVRIAVDDAGAGFASLRHIVELKPAFVKLDRSLVEGIDMDEARQALVAGMRHFAITTGCQLIAEGVETAAELAALRRLEIRFAQGYLFGHPARAEEHPDPAAHRSHLLT